MSPGDVSLRQAQPWHIGTIARRMRADDIRECAGFGHTPKQALRLALTTSTMAWTAFVGDRAEAMFGLVVNSALGGDGAPWMLGTEAIYRHPREMIGWGPTIVARMADSTPHLSGLVGRSNARAIRMLRAWGFAIGTEVIIMRGVEFVAFDKGRG
ncbi:hypothetical protein QH494_15945 [Sphingomonas sp. AR_OL41]|uniref:hypothetical protein n=1 Tax=Sphingomonas sp. AR_OL41 TaxID=3042729 RepID=UPI00248130A5|nr:hypothetical protein [Sphingomonas sp. AR_OL41]MDH7973684.1 hypothetical protein [Sphingomonas sp. AR_OL41]